MQQPDKKVFLYGSYDDPNNFGDIVQLKGALAFHDQLGLFTLVIMLSYRAYKNEKYIESLKKWFDCRYFVFQSDEQQPSPEWSELKKLGEVAPGDFLHVYGGGYLNSMWGDWKIKQIAGIIDKFQVDEYAFSGQQIDKPIVGKLKKELFVLKDLLIFGLRDKQSLGYMQDLAPEVRAHYSFDDVSEIFQAWIAAGHKNIFSRLRQKNSFAVHLNMAGYTGASDQRYNDILDTLIAVRHQYPQVEPVVVHSFNERRPEFTKDSLGTIIELQEDFPYSRHKVVNLAQAALDMNPRKNSYPDVLSGIRQVKFGVACSYHTAMLMSLLSLPVHLIASNDFYRQKKTALGYTDDLDTFLAQPKLSRVDLRPHLKARKSWDILFKETLIKESSEQNK